MLCPRSPAAWVSPWVLFCAFSCGTAVVKDFCLVRIPSLPALISFSPTVSARARPATAAVAGHSFLGEGSLDPAPAEEGRASLEAFDILYGSSVFFRVPAFLQMCPDQGVAELSADVTR